MKKKQPKPKPKPRKPSTALAKRPTATLARAVKAELVKAPAATVALERLTDEPIALSYGVLTFTPQEELVLNEAAPVEEILIKPTGQIYLSHPTYVRWFNRAFGRGQWHLMQLQKPQRTGSTILIQYALVVHHVALYSCYGAAEYHENNREQTYDDVIESTHAYALRRFAKRLGVSLELWDKRFGDDFIRRNAICVKVTGRDGAFKKQWRLKNDAPLRFEAGVARMNDDSDEAQRAQTRRRPQATAERPAATHPKSEEPITSDQVIRFHTIRRRVGRGDDETKDFLKRYYNLDSSKAIKRSDYEDIIKAIEHPGPLLPAVEREPGSDDE